MPVFIVQAVRSSSTADRVADRWPYEANDLNSAKAFVDATPLFNIWDDADSFEITDADGKVLARRPFGSEGSRDADWT